MFSIENVCLSTSDMSINHGTKITIMTTKIYYNMVWRSSSLDSKASYTDKLLSNSANVLDKFYYMGRCVRAVYEKSTSSH
eukprot:13593952-Ditylum_brightwellii.AAC.1